TQARQKAYHDTHYKLAPGLTLVKKCCCIRPQRNNPKVASSS
ncbi:26140_t:CDS:1, partial [Racocetra persica]